MGSLIDKITIIENRLHHTENQDRLHVLREQLHDLMRELDELVRDVMSGRVRLKVYQQYKKYGV